MVEALLDADPNAAGQWSLTLVEEDNVSVVSNGFT
jgi:hypothetical protein